MRSPHVLALALLVPIACTATEILERALVGPEASFGRSILERLSAGDVGPLNAALVPEAKAPDTEAKLRQMAAMFPPVSPIAIKLVSYHKEFPGGAPARTTVRYQWQGGGKLLSASFTLRQEGTGYRVIFANITPVPQQAQQGLTFQGKGVAHKAFAAAGLLVVLIVIAGLVQWVRARGLRKRWLWLGAILLGVGKVALDWTTGQVAASPLAFQLLGVGLARESASAPWILTVSIPLGALAFLLARPGRKPIDSPAAPPAGSLETAGSDPSTGATRSGAGAAAAATSAATGEAPP
jgi:hypothetical protein